MGLEVLYLLISVTFLLAALSLVLFVWAVRAGQFDDLDTPAIRVLFDDLPHPQGPSPDSASETARLATADLRAERME